MQTLSPSSTGTPAFPFDIHSVWGSKGGREEAYEREVEDALIHHIRDFLLFMKEIFLLKNPLNLL